MLNLLNKQCFYWNNRMFCCIKSNNKCSKCCLRPWCRPTIVLLPAELGLSYSPPKLAHFFEPQCICKSF